MRCGGFQNTDVTEEHIGILNNKRAQIETQLIAQGRNGKIEHFSLLEAQHQVVAGMNYLFKVRLQSDGDECVFVRIYRDLQNNTTLHSIEANKKISDNLEPFYDTN